MISLVYNLTNGILYSNSSQTLTGLLSPSMTTKVTLMGSFISSRFWGKSGSSSNFLIYPHAKSHGLIGNISQWSLFDPFESPCKLIDLNMCIVYYLSLSTNIKAPRGQKSLFCSLNASQVLSNSASTLQVLNKSLNEQTDALKIRCVLKKNLLHIWARKSSFLKIPQYGRHGTLIQSQFPSSVSPHTTGVWELKKKKKKSIFQMPSVEAPDRI